MVKKSIKNLIDKILATEIRAETSADKRRVLGQERCRLMAAVSQFQRDSDSEALNKTSREAEDVYSMWEKYR